MELRPTRVVAFFISFNKNPMNTSNENTGRRDPSATGSNPGNMPFSPGNNAKRPMSQAEIDQKINESDKKETGDDVNSEKYAKNKKGPEGPNWGRDGKLDDGTTSSNAGIFK